MVRGPAPKRSEARIRRNAGYNPTKAAIRGEYPAPYEADESWHPIAVELWDSLQESGQAQFYAASDWMAAYIMCEQISREMKPQFIGMVEQWNEEKQKHETVPKTMKVPMKGAGLSALRGMMTDLLITEVHRRRVEIELEHRGEEGGSADPVADEVARKREEMQRKRSS